VRPPDDDDPPHTPAILEAVDHARLALRDLTISEKFEALELLAGWLEMKLRSYLPEDEVRLH
jgi:hypothetical protein